MRQLITIWLSLFVVTNTILAQPEEIPSVFEAFAFGRDSLNPLELLAAADPKMSPDKYTQIETDIAELLNTLEEMRAKSPSEAEFLEKAFHKIHRKQLGWYQEYPLFSSLFEKKTYDCVTGTALFSVILGRMGIDHSIIEFDFHTLLIAHTADRDFLLEATDPLEGFVMDPAEISNRIQHYKEADYVSDEFAKSKSYREISLLQLTGLHYFNLAVDQFNKKDFRKAVDYLERAETVYPSTRVVEIKKLVSTNL